MHGAPGLLSSPFHLEAQLSFASPSSPNLCRVLLGERIHERLDREHIGINTIPSRSSLLSLTTRRPGAQFRAAYADPTGCSIQAFRCWTCLLLSPIPRL